LQLQQTLPCNRLSSQQVCLPWPPTASVPQLVPNLLLNVTLSLISKSECNCLLHSDLHVELIIYQINTHAHRRSFRDTHCKEKKIRQFLQSIFYVLCVTLQLVRCVTTNRSYNANCVVFLIWSLFLAKMTDLHRKKHFCSISQVYDQISATCKVKPVGRIAGLTSQCTDYYYCFL
jgi:hypothetical protein